LRYRQIHETSLEATTEIRTARSYHLTVPTLELVVLFVEAARLVGEEAQPEHADDCENDR
jgi:hypothetical protein